jgi:hypothetical protein
VACDWYEVEGSRFGVRTTSIAFARWIEDVLAAYRVTGPRDADDVPFWGIVTGDGARDAKTETVGRPFNILYRGIVDMMRTLDVRTVARAFLLEVESILFPARDDLVFLDAAAVAGLDRIVLLPHALVPGLARAGRRVQRAGLKAPGAWTVAVDPTSGRLVPVASALDVPGDALDRLAPTFPPATDDVRLFVDAPTSVDAVVTSGGSSDRGVVPAPRAESLLGLLPSVRNLPSMGGRAIESLGRLVGGADCYRARWTGTEQMLDTLTRAIGDGGAR